MHSTDLAKSVLLPSVRSLKADPRIRQGARFQLSGHGVADDGAASLRTREAIIRRVAVSPWKRHGA